MSITSDIKEKAPVAEGEQVRITQAKGRPMLSWVGKRPLREVRTFPAQLVERFAPEAPAGVAAETDWTGWPDRIDRGGLLYHGDNKEVLAHLLANGFRGKVDLVYIDPPFDSGADYVRKVQLRGGSGTARIDGETYTLGEQIQYTDIWANDTYLQFMYERLLLLKVTGRWTDRDPGHKVMAQPRDRGPEVVYGPRLPGWVDRGFSCPVPPVLPKDVREPLP